MLTLVLLAALPLKSDVRCPSVGEIYEELREIREPSLDSSAWVEVLRTGNTIEVGLYDRTGELHAARSVRAAGKTCQELAAKVARIIYSWERLPEPEPTIHRALRERRVPRAQPPEPEPRAEEIDDPEIGRGARVPATLLGAALAAMLPVAAAFMAAPPERGGWLLGATIGFGPPLIASLAFIAHRLTGGKGHYGDAVLGAMAGCGLALIVLFLPGGVKEITQPELLVPAAVLAVGFPALVLELGDARERRELRLAASPVRGGAVIGVEGAL